MLRQALDHRFAKAHASDYLDGALGQSGRRRIEHHSSICPQCRVVLTSLRRMLEELPGLLPHRQVGITDRVLERLRHDA